MKRRLALLLLIFTAAFIGTLGDGPTLDPPPISTDPIEYGGGPDDGPTD